MSRWAKRAAASRPGCLALSQAHNLLTEENWAGASLERVVADTTAYLSGDGKRYEVEGQPVFLGPRAALALSLALHELGTNALKYGALSGDGGKVSISWTLDRDTLVSAGRKRKGRR
jgi:two-component sensor histidine kinase